MNIRIGLIVVWAIVLLLSSCGSREENELRSSLNKAGRNRTELESVLSHYAKDSDSRKLEAARFLIRNMQYHYTRTSPEIVRYYEQMDSISRLTPTRWSVSAEQDSLFGMLDNPFLGRQTKICDSRVIKAEPLIRHIDNAISLYDSAVWCRGLDFGTFCEYLLPYRVAEENPDLNWPVFYKEKVEERANRAFRFCHSLQDTLYTILNRMSTAYKINIRYEERYPYSYRPQQLFNLKRGTCLDYNVLSCFMLRSVGIPAAMDYTPLWGNRSMGHDWSALFVSPEVTGSTSSLDYSFSAAPKPLGTYLKDNPNRPTKIYRTAFSRQKESLAAICGKEEIPMEFRSEFIRDVSREYGLTGQVEVQISKEHRDREFYYLCTFNNRDWVPIAWAQRKGSRIRFSNLGGGIVYLPCKYEKGRMLAVSDPVILHADGSKETLSADTVRRQTVKLWRKYPEGENIRRYSRLFAGGRIEASGYADFRNAVVLHRFPDSVAVNIQHIRLEPAQEMRYLRFVVGSDRCGGEVAEFGVYGIQGEKLQFVPVGNGKWEGKHPLEAAFDGDVLTYAKADSADGNWLGLDLGGMKQVAEIRILPRNDDNFIREGEHYQLQYWNNGRWYTLGERTGDTKQYLEFGSCPTGALFRLRNLTKGREERIFEYRNGKQVWW